MNLAFLVSESLRKFPLHEWVDVGSHRLFVFADAEEQSADDLAQLGRGGNVALTVYENFMYNGLLEKDLLEVHGRHGLDRIIGVSEQDVLRAARIRDFLGLPGQSVASAAAYRDKAVMKDCLGAAGVPVAPFRGLQSPLDLLSFHRDHGLPLFLKPRSSCAGVGVQAIRTESELAECLRAGFSARFPMAEYASDLLIEEFVDGQLYHVDGAVLAGAPVLVVPSRYLAPRLPLSSATLAPDDPFRERLCEVTRAALRALPSPDDFSFHAEIFHTVAGDLLVNEVAARTGGGKIGAALKVISGIDLNHLSVAAQIDSNQAARLLRQATPSNRCAGFSLFPPQQGRRPRDMVGCAFPWVADFSEFVSAGEEPIAAVVVEGGSPGEVEERLEAFGRWLWRRV